MVPMDENIGLFPGFGGLDFSGQICIPEKKGCCKKTVNTLPDPISHRIHVWYIYLHLVDFYAECRYIYIYTYIYIYIYET